MLDFLGIMANLFWVFGLATLLAAWSYSYYEAQTDDRSVRDLLSSPRYRFAITAGLLLFFTGLAATDSRWWARLIWIVLAVAALANYFFTRVNLRRNE